MKALTIVLGLLCAMLSFLLYKNNNSTTQQAEETFKSQDTLSNLVAEVRTRLALEQGNVQEAKDSHSNAMVRFSVELKALSNRLAQATARFAAVQAESGATQAELAVRTARVGEVEAERDRAQHLVDTLQPLQKEVPVLKEQLLTAQQKALELKEQVGRTEVEKAELLRKLEDAEFLRLQAAKVAAHKQLDQAAAKAGPKAKPNPRAPLALQPDGTVRVVSSTAAPAK